MTTHTKVLLFVACFVLMGLLSILNGQGMGFHLRGPLTFGGFSAGTPVWNVGKGLSLVTADVTLHKQLAALEGQAVIITITPASQ